MVGANRNKPNDGNSNIEKKRKKKASDGKSSIEPKQHKQIKRW